MRRQGVRRGLAARPGHPLARRALAGSRAKGARVRQGLPAGGLPAQRDLHRSGGDLVITVSGV